MSCYYYNKPKLVESKIIQKYLNKFKEQNDIIEQNTIDSNIKNNYIYDYLCTIFQRYYGFIILLFLILLLLYIRYLEVCKKKNLLKHLINANNN
jgi:hypothetical protein